MSFKENAKQFVEDHPGVVDKVLEATVGVITGLVLGRVCCYIYNTGYDKGFTNGCNKTLTDIGNGNGTYTATNSATNKTYLYNAVDMSEALKNQ